MEDISQTQAGLHRTPQRSQSDPVYSSPVVIVIPAPVAAGSASPRGTGVLKRKAATSSAAMIAQGSASPMVPDFLQQSQSSPVLNAPDPEDR